MTEPDQSSETIFEYLRMTDLGSRLVSFSDGHALFGAEDQAVDIFLVETGEVRLFQAGSDGRRRLLDILGPSELFGLSSLGKGIHYEKVAISTGKSDVRIVPADQLRDALMTRGDIAVEFIQILARQLHNNSTEGNTLIFADCRVRLIQKLLWFANSPAARHLPEGVELRITHAQLAQSIGAARETVSLCLMSLRRENLVRTGRNRVMYDPASLCRSFPDARPTAELAIAV